MRTPLSQKVLALVLIPLVVSSFLLLSLAVQLQKAETQAQREGHAREVRGQCTIVDNFAHNAVKGLVDFSVNQDEHYIAVTKDALVQLGPELSRLENLVKSSPRQLETLKAIRYLTDRIQPVALLAEKSPPDLIGMQRDLPKLWESIGQLSIELRKLNIFESRSRETGRRDEQRLRDQVKETLFVGALLNGLIACLLCIFAARQIVRRLSIIRQNNERLAKRQELLPPSGGDDEIAEIDKGFHDMALALAEYVRKEQAMFENANDIICSLDADLVFLRINSASTQIIGYAPDEVVGTQLRSILAEPSVESSISNLKDVVSNKSSATFEISINTKSGPATILRCTAHWAERDNALFCVMHDITELKRLERTKQDFVAMVSHDLRSPLMSIRATLEILEEGIYGQLTKQGQVAIGAAQRNTFCLLTLIGEILDIEKIESGRFQLSQKSLKVKPIIERAIELVKDLADKKKIVITVPETDIKAFVDEDRLLQVILNLLSNAIKYSPSQTEVTVVVENSADSLVEVRVSDAGQGIPDHLHEAIFDRFQQASIADWKEKGGSGLGLAICKSLIEAHNGKIGVMSTPGQGSTFWFRVPMEDQ